MMHPKYAPTNPFPLAKTTLSGHAVKALTFLWLEQQQPDRQAKLEPDP